MTDHISVMMNEVLENLLPQKDELYLDCTFGAGGYTKSILKAANCKVLSLDADPTTFEYATKIQEEYGSRFEYVNDNFRNIARLFSSKTKFDGAVYDLGVSSMQLDRKERGFSFQGDEKLDMRMSGEGESAYDLVNDMEEDALADVIYLYGDERNSRKIAKKIVNFREKKKIETTKELADIVSSCVPFRGKIHPATKTFQAIRIAVNDEMGALRDSLNALPEILNIGARVVIVTFHSIEDKIVKDYFKENSDKKIAISKYKTQEIKSDKKFKIITNKAVKPSREEILNNPRARSAKLRAVERIGGINEA